MYTIILLYFLYIIVNRLTSYFEPISCSDYMNHLVCLYLFCIFQRKVADYFQVYLNKITIINYNKVFFVYTNKLTINRFG